MIADYASGLEDRIDILELGKEAMQLHFLVLGGAISHLNGPPPHDGVDALRVRSP